jgi:glutathione synthase/RimK-type ligase-like ATP-grasp enzyme
MYPPSSCAQKKSPHDSNDRMKIAYEFNNDDTTQAGNIVIMAEPIDANDGKETIFALANRLFERGHKVAFTSPDDLTIRVKKGKAPSVTAFASSLDSIQCDPPTWIPGDPSSIELGKTSYAVTEKQKIDLLEADLILYLKEPEEQSPEFLKLINRVFPKGTIVNDPGALLLYGSKTMLGPTIADTTFTRDPAEIRADLQENRDIITKPLCASTGYGVNRMKIDNGEEVELAAPKDILAIQPRLPGIDTEGDISVWHVNGKPISGMRRMLGANPILTHLRHGGRLGSYPLQETDMPVLMETGRLFHEDGIFFARCDFIRDKNGELSYTDGNVNFPMLLPNSEALNIVEKMNSGTQPTDLVGTIVRACENQIQKRENVQQTKHGVPKITQTLAQGTRFMPGDTSISAPLRSLIPSGASLEESPSKGVS